VPDGVPPGPPPPPPWGTPGPSAPLGGGALGWPPPPPPRRGRLTWLWVLLAVVAGLGVVAIVSVVVMLRAVDAPVSAMNRYLAAVDRDDYDRAYDMLCQAERDSTSRESFPAAITPFADDLGDYLAFSFDPIGDERTVYYSIDGDGSDPYSAVVVREDGEWRVCDFFE
jgi:hypothetical protein